MALFIDFIVVAISSYSKKPTMPNRKIMAIAARIDKLAPDREASVRSRGIFLHVSSEEFACEQSASFV